jgi:hypothetical protein
MQKYFKTTILAVGTTILISTSANAWTKRVPVCDNTNNVPDTSVATQKKQDNVQLFKIGSKIGVARLDKGRLIPAPTGELLDWKFLDNRSAANFEPISAAAHIKNLPEIPMDGRDTYNQIDEIRLTAFDLKMDYVLVYGLGRDAQWGSIGGKALIETGLRFDEDEISPRAGAKALLVDTYTGEVFGTVTSEETEFGVGDLTEKVDALIGDLISNEDRA